MLHQEKELSNEPGRPLSYNNSTGKKQNGCCLEAVLFCIFSVELSLQLPSFKVRGLQNDYRFCISVKNISIV